MTSIHGHEVLNMMLDSETGYSEKSLEQAIIAKFGDEARFHTCSAQGMTAGELVLFLAERGKFIPQQDGFTTHESKICHH
ncbi:putative metal-binding protein [Enterobacter sp. BIGb0383]|uniref:YecH family metal-binding protein n=1 Tax=unclassified Enterobacter TaxID=2608935 RepID=UPI000F4A70B7|nr:MULTISPECIES: YecH family metal-binding protein [unclassified Enterobacter]ROP62524.1 putative metal-binding protein [Enterobacter sp. BIGb0383]ROS12685.1 putative metal-binding protein [Enterobacter sp. BIGb0359]